MDRAGLHNSEDSALRRRLANNEVLIDLDVRETSEQALDQGKIEDHQGAARPMLQRARLT